MYARHLGGAAKRARAIDFDREKDNLDPVTIRPAVLADAEICGRIIHEAFDGIAARHGFPPDFPTVAAAVDLARSFIANPAIFGIVAESNGRVVGSNFLGEGDAIRGVGPITVDKSMQGRGIGRRLMLAVLERAQGAAGIRLVQDSFNMNSLSLYASLGFEVREPLLLMTGRPAGEAPAGTAVRPMTMEDLDACDALCMRVHGVTRRHELADAVRLLAPLLAEREGRVTAYMTAPTFWIANHGVAESHDDLRNLMLAAAAFHNAPLSLLLPTRQAALVRWCLSVGMRAVKPMTLMTIGQFRDPDGSYFPSVMY